MTLREFITEASEGKKTATFVKDIYDNERVEKKLYKCNPPMEDYDYVIVSAGRSAGEAETFIFGSNKRGKMLSYDELQGSITGTINHDKALRKAGYKPVY